MAQKARKNTRHQPLSPHVLSVPTASANTSAPQNSKIMPSSSPAARAVSAAALMARQGADITIVYLSQEQGGAEDTKRLVECARRRCLLVPFDLENYRDAPSIIEKHMKGYGRLDAPGNNASKKISYSELMGRVDTVSSTFTSNIPQMFAIVKFALPHMKKGPSAPNTTPVAASRGTPSIVDYAATKGAIVAFTRALSKTLTPKGIRVNAVGHTGPCAHPVAISVKTRRADGRLRKQFADQKAGTAEPCCN
ncbi:unnamed protein product [Tuber aestivum]|uniref:Uncharacterized protein n=1 Tax=Tuber aestivum TaxID=59557 RepID=A0A292PMX4_9PEZI|nr:unnamed protein product [Tuber aestivum]